MKQNIEKTFIDRNLWKNNRTSAVFPCYINNNNDQIICFQNYWRWKNKIDDVFLILKIVDQKSIKTSSKKIKILEHNSISIKKTFRINNFKGLVECQFFSKSNLRYPYPAIYCFYENKNNCISVVHSAGRIQNITEKKINEKFEESNFFCKFNENFEPFMHFFNGIKQNPNESLQVKVLSFKNNLILKKNFVLKLKKPLCSKIVFLSDIFSKKELKKIKDKNFYIRVKRKVLGVFGRIVAGNYNKKLDAFFTTHSLSTYDNAKKIDEIKPVANYESSVFLPLTNTKPLNLKTICYPINQKFNAIFEEKVSKGNNLNLRKTKKKIYVNNQRKNKTFDFLITKKENRLYFSKQRLPGRIYISHNYSLKNSQHPTDIGTSFHNIYTPLKFNHWGQGVSKKDFNTILFVRNFSHQKIKNEISSCTLELFTNKKRIIKKTKVKSDCCVTIPIKELNKNLKTNYFSWKLSSKQKNLDIIWVSYNKKTGEICGDHSF